MLIIADLQLHSKYSRAVSPKMDLNEIARWSSKKGIGLVATGDWTHPLWFREIKANLVESNPGIYQLKTPPTKETNPAQFLLSTEISSIYSHAGQTRRVHNLIFSPSVDVCEKINAELNRRGCKLMADGRPIVGLSSKELLQLCLEIDDNIMFIPAHAWTPWFALFGSKSGYDSIKDCFEELDKHIYAIETGLSSDPAMNWQISELDNRSIVSFSDAHSGPKLGREATVFVSKTTNNISYQDVADAIKQKADGHLKIGYTIEFFPEEGKYHLTGHRDCGVKLAPDETEKQGIICPVCKKPLTVGVEDRVRKLASRIYRQSDLLFIKNPQGVTFVYDKDKKRTPFVSLVPLLEILIEVFHSSTKAAAEYERLTTTLGTEFDILLHLPLDEIERNTGTKIVTAVKLVRNREVTVDPGFDGVFGRVKLFNDDEKTETGAQATLF